ncbi:MAG: hypothetical protein HYU28_04680 [Actinobacteria bacterium]|nr:hypothetical protein [Actinomycetota bacterium]
MVEVVEDGVGGAVELVVELLVEDSGTLCARACTEGAANMTASATRNVDLRMPASYPRRPQ